MRRWVRAVRAQRRPVIERVGHQSFLIRDVSKSTGVLVLIFLLALQVFALVYLCRLYRGHRRFYRNACLTDGIVVGTRKFSADEGPDYFARIFYTVLGTQYEIK